MAGSVTSATMSALIIYLIAASLSSLDHVYTYTVYYLHAYKLQVDTVRYGSSGISQPSSSICLFQPLDRSVDLSYHI